MRISGVTVCEQISMYTGSIVSVTYDLDEGISVLLATRCQDTSDPGHFGPKTFRH